MKKTITIYGNNQAETLVIMHAVDEEGKQVWEACLKRGCSDFALAVISGVSWEQDMSPWEAPAAFKKGDAFAGGADAYLQELTGKIIPEIFEQMGRRPEQIILAGYSLAGLFALYAAYQTDIFHGIVSASGSLWYPKFMDFALSHRLSDSVRRIYLSVGDKEAKTRNVIMQSVEENTRRMAEYVQRQGIEEIFELNEGGHFVDDADRLAKGICWMLEQSA